MSKEDRKFNAKFAWVLRELLERLAAGKIKIKPDLGPWSITILDEHSHYHLNTPDGSFENLVDALHDYFLLTAE